jgi:hypothetical protein
MNLAHQNILGFPFSLFYCIGNYKIIKVFAPSGDEEKNINRRARGDRRAFFPKDEKHESFYESFIPSASSRISAVCGSFLLLGNENLSFSSSSEDQDKRMTEEEAESAEILL